MLSILHKQGRQHNLYVIYTTCNNKADITLRYFLKFFFIYIIVDFLFARSTKPSTNARGLNDLLAHSPGFENDMPEQMLSTIVTIQDDEAAQSPLGNTSININFQV